MGKFQAVSVSELKGKRRLAFGVRPSMGSVGDAYDNALCESFFATLECELLDRERFRTPAEARRALFDSIEGWYNPHRRHSALGYESPLRYERLHAAGAVMTTSPETSAAVLPLQATIGQGGAISLSPKSALPPLSPTVVEHEQAMSTPPVHTSAVHPPPNRGNSRSGWRLVMR